MTQPIGAFDKAGVLQVIVESPRGATLKMKFDEAIGLFRVSRPLPAGFTYPCDWGFVPGTRAADGDPVDAFVWWNESSFPGAVIAARMVAVLRVEQKNRQSNARERNDRLLTVPEGIPAYAHIKNLDDVPQRHRDELAHFFSAVVAFEGKELRLLGWGDAGEAADLVRRSMQTAK
ncbi:MAG TPA: inorganic diphosphatase [Vicinamibacterales bacterium]|jgi:inorganic pyrophosphatase